MATDRLLKRKYLLDNLPLILREIYYHRDHEDDEKMPFAILSHIDNDSGKLKIYEE